MLRPYVREHRTPRAATRMLGAVLLFSLVSWVLEDAAYGTAMVCWTALVFTVALSKRVLLGDGGGRAAALGRIAVLAAVLLVAARAAAETAPLLCAAAPA